ncbi:hypothetical protein MED222_05950 [Vibrio sp. MED222]|nr:hypothetical protein MED222_05950 [Vibrio sp. MED222]
MLNNNSELMEAVFDLVLIRLFDV